MILKCDLGINKLRRFCLLMWSFCQVLQRLVFSLSSCRKMYAEFRKYANEDAKAGYRYDMVVNGNDCLMASE